MGHQSKRVPQPGDVKFLKRYAVEEDLRARIRSASR